jgi:phosphate transport system permease protein
MAVTMLIGNSRVIDLSFFAKGDSIASIIANQLTEANGPEHRSALVFLGLVLLVITAVLNIIGRLMIRRMGKTGRRAKAAAKPAEAVAETTTSPAPAAPARTLRFSSGRRSLRVNAIMTWVLGLCLAASVGPLFLILGYVTYRGVTAINFAFFTQMPPGMLSDTSGGLKHAIIGSAMMVSLATVVAVPIGILAAIYLAEYRTQRLTALIRFVAEILGGVPSIIMGIFGYALLVAPPWSKEPWGYSAWAGAFALGVMMLPIVIRATEEAIKLVPQALRHASYALGAAYWQTVVRVTVPAALPAIITGVFLAVGRIAGETAPLLLTANGSKLMAESPTDPTAFIPYYIYDYGKSGYEAAEQKAWAAAFVLLAVIMTLNVGIRYISGQRVVAAARGD